MLEDSTIFTIQTCTLSTSISFIHVSLHCFRQTGSPKMTGTECSRRTHVNTQQQHISNDIKVACSTARMPLVPTHATTTADGTRNRESLCHGQKKTLNSHRHGLLVQLAYSSCRKRRYMRAYALRGNSCVLAHLTGSCPTGLPSMSRN